MSRERASSAGSEPRPSGSSGDREGDERNHDRRPSPGGGRRTREAHRSVGGEVTYLVGVVTLIGVWIGAAPLFVAVATSYSGVSFRIVSMFAGFGLPVLVLGGPVVAVVVGRQVADRATGSLARAGAVAGVASGVAHLLATGLAGGLLFVAIDQMVPTTDIFVNSQARVLDATELSDLTVPLVAVAVATGLVGAVVAAVGRARAVDGGVWPGEGETGDDIR